MIWLKFTPETFIDIIIIPSGVIRPSAVGGQVFKNNPIFTGVYLHVQGVSEGMVNNINMTSHNFNSFSDEKIFIRTLRIPYCCNIRITLLSK